jgi:hypothetical protein
MIHWEIETPRRRETIRYGYVDDQLKFRIQASGVGGPWSLFVLTPDSTFKDQKDQKMVIGFLNPGLAKVHAEAIAFKKEW